MGHKAEGYCAAAPHKILEHAQGRRKTTTKNLRNMTSQGHKDVRKTLTANKKKEC